MNNFDRFLIFLAFVSIICSNIAHYKNIKRERERIDTQNKLIIEMIKHEK